MKENQAENPVLQAISEVKHPFMDCTLCDLGILCDPEIFGEKTVIATFIFPFQKIPIKDKLIALVEKTASEYGYNLEYIVRYMSKQEKQHFLKLEKLYHKTGNCGDSCG